MLLTKKSVTNTIKVVIYYTYENLKIRKEIIKSRKKFMIPNRFFETHKLDDNSNFDSPTLRCMFAWADKYLKDQNILNLVIKNIGEENYKIAMENYKIVAKKTTNKTIKEDSKLKYAFNALNKHISQYSNIDFYKSAQLNPTIYWVIIGSKLFEVPQNIVIKHIDENLDNYFQTANSQEGESISEKHVKYIKYTRKKSDCNKKSEGATKTVKVPIGYRYNINKRLEYPRYNIDKKAYKSKNDDSEILCADNVDETEFNPYDDSHFEKRIKKFKDFIQPYRGYFMGKLAYKLSTEQKMSNKEIAKKFTDKIGSIERKKYKKYRERYQLSKEQIKKYKKCNWFKNYHKVEYGKYKDYHVAWMIKKYLEFIGEIS